KRWSRRDILHLSSLAFSATAFFLVQYQVPDPYLDEIFHIPQTQRYCDEDFDSWDPAITTPPGLYLLTAIPLMTVHLPCTPPMLRLGNLVFSGLVIPALISGICEQLVFDQRKQIDHPRLKHPEQTDYPHSTPEQIDYPHSTREAQKARNKGPRVASIYRPFWKHLVWPDEVGIVIGNFPIVWFFGLLFYTDVASLAGVLGALFLGLKRSWWASSLIGAWSITVRQTNVVWLAFTFAISLLYIAREEENKRTKEDITVSSSDPLLADMRSPVQIATAITQTSKLLFFVPRKVLRVVVPYLPTFLGFIIFLRWNGGIVLGHKELHKPVLHTPQLFYFVAFSSILLAPNLLAEGLKPLLRGSLTIGFSTFRRTLISLVVLGAINLAVHRYTMYHPFLLADNRHYVFYLLRWVFLPFPAAKYLVTPLYLFGFLAWAWRLRHSATVLWTIGFLGCTALVLIPTPLIEPRYFLIPTLLLRIQLQSNSPPAALKHQRNTSVFVLVEWGWYFLINCVTLGLFLGRKFRWEGWDGWMRFMW
ncbi:DIE2/ALG10 family-domain-containing protein, partial [Naematelia encephala]